MKGFTLDGSGFLPDHVNDMFVKSISFCARTEMDTKKIGSFLMIILHKISVFKLLAGS